MCQKEEVANTAAFPVGERENVLPKGQGTPEAARTSQSSLRSQEPKSVVMSRRGPLDGILSSHHPRLRTGGNGREQQAAESSLRIWDPFHA
ncbi:hypothetical protein OOU_Y34scaffold00519g21 [Pyricularia oryzae Y34]|uniref:Uncharacterized protein n=1 Tax=Pyricularia oryzae (strain Y34) TaxID=1143189 RepID=A0AA97PLD3_PYRO3|nr:hypothetical protein OOU_Y34scaffold00519g21 [Pyricularia oryzae Y34]